MYGLEYKYPKTAQCIGVLGIFMGSCLLFLRFRAGRPSGLQAGRPSGENGCDRCFAPELDTDGREDHVSHLWASDMKTASDVRSDLNDVCQRVSTCVNVCQLECWNLRSPD